jgi:hypothetical protein
VARIRRLDPETRMFVGALLAGLIGLLIVGASAATTATSPSAPFLWFASGALAYWLTDRRGEDAARAGSDPVAV